MLAPDRRKGPVGPHDGSVRLRRLRFQIWWQVDAGIPVTDLCLKHGYSQGSDDTGGPVRVTPGSRPTRSYAYASVVVAPSTVLGVLVAIRPRRALDALATTITHGE
jgi:hypothetical protein